MPRRSSGMGDGPGCKATCDKPRDGVFRTQCFHLEAYRRASKTDNQKSFVEKNLAITSLS
jgi:hypothetical protein